MRPLKPTHWTKIAWLTAQEEAVVKVENLAVALGLQLDTPNHRAELLIGYGFVDETGQFQMQPHRTVTAFLWNHPDPGPKHFANVCAAAGGFEHVSPQIALDYVAASTDPDFASIGLEAP